MPPIGLNSPASLEAARALHTQSLIDEARRLALHLGVTGFGVGAAGRGAMGVYNLIRRGLGKVEPSSPILRPEIVDIPVPERDESKAAAALPPAVLPPKLPRPPRLPKPPKPPRPPKQSNFLTHGSNPDTIWGLPWAMPATIGAGAAGVAGGWKLMDYLLDKRRKQELQGDLDRAKNEYEKALMGQFQAKTSSAIATDLDHLTDLVEKRSEDVNWWGKDIPYLPDTADDWANNLGWYGLYAGLTGLTSGMLAYNVAKKKQRKVLMEKARRQLERRRALVRPTPMLMHPVPTPSVGKPQSVVPQAERDELFASNFDEFPKVSHFSPLDGTDLTIASTGGDDNISSPLLDQTPAALEPLGAAPPTPPLGEPTASPMAGLSGWDAFAASNPSAAINPRTGLPYETAAGQQAIMRKFRQMQGAGGLPQDDASLQAALNPGGAALANPGSQHAQDYINMTGAFAPPPASPPPARPPASTLTVDQPNPVFLARLKAQRQARGRAAAGPMTPPGRDMFGNPQYGNYAVAASPEQVQDLLHRGPPPDLAVGGQMHTDWVNRERAATQDVAKNPLRFDGSDQRMKRMPYTPSTSLGPSPRQKPQPTRPPLNALAGVPGSGSMKNG